MKEKTKELETKNVKKNPTTSKSYSRIVSEPTSEVRDLNQKIDELLNVVINLIKLLTTHQASNSILPSKCNSNASSSHNGLNETLSNLTQTLLKLANKTNTPCQV